MKLSWDTQKQPKLLLVHVFTKSPKRVLISVGDMYKPDTYYSKQETTVNGNETFEISLPLTPDKAFFEITEVDDNPLGINMGDVKFRLEQKPFKPKWNCDFNNDPLLQDFLRFITWFAENKSIISATYGNQEASVYKSMDGKFEVKYVWEIIDNEKYSFLSSEVAIPNPNYGKPSPTSFRVHSETRVMEVAKKYALGYSIPQMIALFCHELSHGWINKNPESEEEADYHAINICRCLGFGKREIGEAFLKVFARYPSDQNVRRTELIMEQLKNMP